jgi:hypothetical protein
MADIVVRDYNSNNRDTNLMVSNLIKYRKSHTSSLIRQGGGKLEKIINDNDYANVQSAGSDTSDAENEVSNSGSEFLNKLYSTALQSISSAGEGKK